MPTATSNAPRSRVSHRAVAAVLIAGLAVRMLVFLVARPWAVDVERDVVLYEDAVGYHLLATTLLAHGRFAKRAQDPPEVLRTPLYPMFVAAWYRLVGPRPWVVLVAQILLDMATALLLFRALRGPLGGRAGLAAALVYALDPFAVFCANTLMSETLFLFLLVAGATLFLTALEARFAPGARGALAGAAAAFGLATLTRPTALYLPAALAMVIAVTTWPRARRALGAIALFALAFGVVIAPWLVRNRLQFGATALSTSGDYNLLVLVTAPMLARREGGQGGNVQQRVLREADSLFTHETPVAEHANDFSRARYYRRVALRYIARDPAAFAIHVIRSEVAAFANLGTKGYVHLLGFGRVEGPAWRARILVGGVVALYLAVCLGATVIGLGLAWRRRVAPAACLFLIVTAAYFLVVGGAAAQARLRLPAAPFTAGFAGLALASAHALMPRRRGAVAGTRREE